MKAKAVSVSRDKRGLPVVMRPALPHVVELTSQTTQKRKTDTMKDYILHTQNTVEPQRTLSKNPSSLADISSRGSQPCVSPAAGTPVLFIGMDVHNDSIA